MRVKSSIKPHNWSAKSSLLTIPTSRVNINFSQALCELGASVSFLLLSVTRKLGLTELKNTNISLQLANRSIRHPLGVLKNVLIKVGKFIIPMDFVVLDIKEDFSLPIILGKPFITIVGAIIDATNGKLKLQVREDEIEFDLNDMVKYPSSTFDIYFVETIMDSRLPNVQYVGFKEKEKNGQRIKMDLSDKLNSKVNVHPLWNSAIQ